MTTIVFGDGGLGSSVAEAMAARDQPVRLIGRPATGGHDPADLHGADVLVEASRADAVVGNLAAGLAAGARRVVIATTGWSADRAAIDGLLAEQRAAAVWAPNFSLGVVLFGRLVDAAVELFGPLAAYDPYVVEWHRRTKPDRPSGTALDLAERIVARHPAKAGIAPPSAGRPPGADELEVATVRAGASPGMHLVGFDAAGESIELRLTARDRSAYAAGILAATDWLRRERRPAGLHAFDVVVDELLSPGVRPVAA